MDNCMPDCTLRNMIGNWDWSKCKLWTVEKTKLKHIKTLITIGRTRKYALDVHFNPLAGCIATFSGSGMQPWGSAGQIRGKLHHRLARQVEWHCFSCSTAKIRKLPGLWYEQNSYPLCFFSIFTRFHPLTLNGFNWNCVKEKPECPRNRTQEIPRTRVPTPKESADPFRSPEPDTQGTQGTGAKGEPAGEHQRPSALCLISAPWQYLTISSQSVLHHCINCINCINCTNCINCIRFRWNPDSQRKVRNFMEISIVVL